MKKKKEAQGYLATIHFVPRQGVLEERILWDIADILDEAGYNCSGLVALTKDVKENNGKMIDFEASYAKHRDKIR